MTVKAQTATVFQGGRRRWFSLDAACNAEASAILKRFCDCSPGNGHDVAPETCAMHADAERFIRVRAKLAARARRHAMVMPIDAPAPELRALAACREVVAAKADVARTSRLIGEALSACHEAWLKERSGSISFDYNSYESHLARAYAAEEVESDYDYGTHKEWLSEADKLEIFAECPHCMAAHNAVQQRKLARKRLGLARRAVTLIGRLS